jgi:hypothetical protein
VIIVIDAHRVITTLKRVVCRANVNVLVAMETFVMLKQGTFDHR